MVKETKYTGLSRDMIIHPGETIAELLEDRDMTQKELAIRTGVTPKHISKVVNGQANITAAFAKKLEYAFEISADFWLNLQANYDRELQEYEEYHSVTDDEIALVEYHADTVQKLVQENYIEDSEDEIIVVLNLRLFLRLSNLALADSLVLCLCSKEKISEPDAFIWLVNLRCMEH